MKKYFLVLLCALPFVAQAQLRAVAPDATKPTKWLTGKPESVYVFFDKTTATLSARDTAGVVSDFKWHWLNPVDTSFTLQKTETGIASSSLTLTAAGGYQVQVTNALRDTTFSCWVFFDNFRIDTMSYENSCDALRLDMTSTPSIYAGYSIYNFANFLTPPHVGDSTYSGIQSIHWDAVENIHQGVDNPDESWKQRKANYTIVEDPPPLKNSKYTLNVKDVFGKSADYTTSYTVPAIAAYAKITAQEWIDNSWRGISDPATIQGEALYKVQFSQEKSLNAQDFSWKGFGNEQIQGQGQLVMWEDHTTTLNSWITPKVPYKGHTLDGYVPGKYRVHLTAVNTTTQARCSGTAEIQITIDPSRFDAAAIPNAFTPNGDGQNDIFKFVQGQEPVSMEYIKVYIYSRSGMLVYSYDGRADAWTGWNGQLMNNRGDVADGVYFYVISGQGWDDVQYNTSEFKGALHIFR